MLVFMALYSVSVMGFFACLAALSRNGRPLETLEDMSGLFQQRPWLSLSLTIFALSGLGLPPFAGFWGKYYVFKAAVNAGDPILLWAAVAALVGSVIAAFYYLRLVKVMWLDPAPGPTDTPPVEAGVIAIGAAALTFPVVLALMPAIDSYARAAAAALGLG
jgi:NADH-quinone oxidoreductase subunit N